jgi:peptidoglycan/xylan/chitin deacetylase (PgdA/CDA1 family)
MTSVNYTVRSGDTLGSIARAFDSTWQSLVYWNQEAYPGLNPDNSAYNPNYLAIGWQLRVLPGVVVPFDAPPPPVPTAAPTPKPPPSVTGRLVTNGSRATNRVALTFDMGGRVGDALAIMSWLRDHNVRATIFMTGSMADSSVTDAARQVLARVDARPDLFDLGNHSYSHPHMTTLSAAAMADEIQRAEGAIDRHAASSPRPFFRPPYGEWNQALLDAAASAGYPSSIMWDVDTIDWKPISEGGPTAAQIINKVATRAQGGSIVLMHLGGYETLDALPGIVNGLRARGLQLVTLGELLGG